MSRVELRGLRNLLGLDDLLITSKQEITKEIIFHLPIQFLVSGKYQPRSLLDDDSLHELVLSIQSQGILLPLIVRRLAEDKFEIIAGERRWRAAVIAQLKTVPVMIKDISDQTACAFALIENIQRESLNAIDEAMAFDRLLTEFFLTHEEIAERVGRSRSAVTNILRLLSLDNQVKEMLRTRRIEMGHARALLVLDKTKQCEVAESIIRKHLSVRETERFVQQLKMNSKVKVVNPYQDQIKDWQQVLTKKLSSAVIVKLNNKGKGKIIITISSPAEIDLIINNLN